MIQEDPDELGFWIDARPDKGKRPAHGGYPSFPQRTTLARCNSILLPGEQKAIEAAALVAYRGDEDYAERFRARTDYDRLSDRSDADGDW